MSLDPQKLGDYGTFGAFVLALLGSLWALLKYPFMSKSHAYQTFVTKEKAEESFVKIANHDGTRSYVHPNEWDDMKKKIDEALDQNRALAAVCREWINKP